MRSLVVGCSTGMGAATVQRLHRLEHQVVGLDRADPSDPDLYTAFHQVDLKEGNQVEAFVQRMLEEDKPLWAIAYCAAFYYPRVAFEDYTLELWDEVININLRSAFIILHGLAPLLEEGGRIVTISSGAAHGGSMEFCYGASKAGLVGLTKSLARNLADKKIQANSVAPGAVNTNMMARMPEQGIRNLQTHALRGKWGEPDEIAVAVEWLINPENTFTNGVVIDVNGGGAR
jgi:3-oxoacyl-[acyl-carrier protein] reductase